jgi:ATP-dependent helicase/nuclease subunit A
MAATKMPSKQTATDRKGRDKDQEVHENTAEAYSIPHQRRRPSVGAARLSGTEYGTVMHAVMQYISFEKCKDRTGICEEITRLVKNGFLTREQADSVNPETLHRFFSTDIGRKLCGGVSYLREFKFSILDNGEKYDPALEGEQVLLQGVVDCALLEEDGITVVDFKTDYVTEETVSKVISRYRSQVETYAEALQRIYQQPVRERYLYLFHLNQFVAI